MSVLMAPVKDGVIQETDSQASIKKAQTTAWTKTRFCSYW